MLVGLISKTGWLSIMPAVSLVSACASGGAPYYEPHHVSDLTVVFLDQATLRTYYTRIMGKPATGIRASAYGTSVETVKGFYDYETHTLYCSRMDFEVCGHELHHAVIGRFHSH
jgi:hypothetical protein